MFDDPLGLFAIVFGGALFPLIPIMTIIWAFPCCPAWLGLLITVFSTLGFWYIILRESD